MHLQVCSGVQEDASLSSAPVLSATGILCTTTIKYLVCKIKGPFDSKSRSVSCHRQSNCVKRSIPAGTQIAAESCLNCVTTMRRITTNIIEWHSRIKCKIKCFQVLKKNILHLKSHPFCCGMWSDCLRLKWSVTLNLTCGSCDHVTQIFPLMKIRRQKWFQLFPPSSLFLLYCFLSRILKVVIPHALLFALAVIRRVCDR